MRQEIGDLVQHVDAILRLREYPRARASRRSPSAAPASACPPPGPCSAPCRSEAAATRGRTDAWMPPRSAARAPPGSWPGCARSTFSRSRTWAIEPHTLVPTSICERSSSGLTLPTSGAMAAAHSCNSARGGLATRSRVSGSTIRYSSSSPDGEIRQPVDERPSRVYPWKPVTAMLRGPVNRAAAPNVSRETFTPALRSPASIASSQSPAGTLHP